MAATREMAAIALQARPHAACIVPERREERTTEGGLDAAGQQPALRRVGGLQGARHPRLAVHRGRTPRQIEAAAALGAPVVELHTGAWCEAVRDGDARAGGAPSSSASGRRGAQAAGSASRSMPAMASTT